MRVIGQSTQFDESINDKNGQKNWTENSEVIGNKYANTQKKTENVQKELFQNFTNWNHGQKVSSLD